ncbi:SDR family oxidoreductase [Curtobacterium sp. MCBD17_032]|uniref:SDR family oxidoreductase n=1 Tax=Curtobacterium sp. MCBD17_032 TaxID=2175659 RepID=UPI000DA91952|nr:SDR family oxidoreductase [Curtobacterium sp. MCBD17_032]PZE84386.1 short-chain dehydrogenase/reductase [Curtobacterium sp. MCBD17_032]
MIDTQVWLVTGASRGMGTEFARAALTAGHHVVATGRDAQRVRDAVGEHDNLLAVALDVTDESAATTAVAAATEQFGRIDVLVNNAGSFQAGFFEELSAEQFRTQMDTNFFGALNVTRAVLPFMRQQRSGRIISISSTAGIVANAGGSAYSASKFALEGWMEALRGEVEPFGIHTTVVEPGFFRTDLLAEGNSTFWGDVHVDDYAPLSDQAKGFFRSMEGRQTGDPAKLAQTIIKLAAMPEPPLRLPAGEDSVDGIVQKGAQLAEQARAFPELSDDLNHEGAAA